MVGIRQFDESEMIGKALSVFRSKGLAATSMNDLAEATGVHRGSLYNAYGGKDAIFLIAFEIYTVEYLDMIQEVFKKASARAAIEAFFDVVITSMCTGSPSRGCFSTRTASEAPRTSPEILKRVRSWLQELESTVQRALSDPEFSEQLSLPPADVAKLLVNFTRGLAVMEQLFGNEEELRSSAQSLTILLTR